MHNLLTPECLPAPVPGLLTKLRRTWSPGISLNWITTLVEGTFFRSEIRPDSGRLQNRDVRGIKTECALRQWTTKTHSDIKLTHFGYIWLDLLGTHSTAKGWPILVKILLTPVA